MQDTSNRLNYAQGTDGIWEITVVTAQFSCKSKTILSNEVYMYK